MAASRNNVRKRGSTWTYYAYVTDGTGKRRQVSKGGFATRRAAEAARVEALAAMANGGWVRPERLTVRDFLVGEWLPTHPPRPPPHVGDHGARLGDSPSRCARAARSLDHRGHPRHLLARLPTLHDEAAAEIAGQVLG